MTRAEQDIFREAYKLTGEYGGKRPLTAPLWDEVNGRMLGLMDKAKRGGCELLAANLLVGVHEWLESTEGMS